MGSGEGGTEGAEQGRGIGCHYEYGYGYLGVMPCWSGLARPARGNMLRPACSGWKPTGGSHCAGGWTPAWEGEMGDGVFLAHLCWGRVLTGECVRHGCLRVDLATSTPVRARRRGEASPVQSANPYHEHRHQAPSRCPSPHQPSTSKETSDRTRRYAPPSPP